MPVTKPFLQGKTVFLRAPDLQSDVVEGNWHEWFNDYETTRFLVHGIYPVSPERELEIVKGDLDRSDHLVLVIADAEDQHPLGIVSLTEIDHINRRAEIAIVMGERRKLGAALEAMALMTGHAFDRLNLEKLYAGQHEGLWKWINTLELIGYRLEGYRRDFGRRDDKAYGVALTGVTADVFNALRRERNGDILGSDLLALLRQRSPENKIRLIIDFLESMYGD